VKFLHLRRRTKSAAAGEGSANILLIPAPRRSPTLPNVAGPMTVSEANVSSTHAHKEAHETARPRPAIDVSEPPSSLNHDEDTE